MNEKQPVTTSASIPKAPTVIHDASLPVEADSIIARPLMEPDFVNMKSKNPNISLRWVNCKSGDGLRYNHMQAVGFVNATSSDVAAPASMLKEGKIVFGDLILMKIDRAKYQGALKYNEQQALARMRKTTQVQHARKTVSEVPTSPELIRKIQMFEPSLEETQKLIGEEGGQSG